MDHTLMVEIDGAEPLSTASVKALAGLCDRAEDRGGSGVVIVQVTGAPAGDWSSGLDVMLVSKWERAVRRLERLPMATLALAHGECGGTALDAFLAADIRVAALDTRLLVHGDGSATWPGMAGFRLVQLAGAARTRRAVLFGLPIDAPEARTLGIVDGLVDDPEQAVAAAAGLVSGLSGKDLAIRRQLLLDARTTSFEDALGPHLAACDRVLRSAAQEAS
ncbi:enoyl-CoA-hydratase DpgB [Streptomyces sp. NPDC057654]|uniref:enoyl-CoA-hydratase DpgB n=1 Tax=Streptomyces sp. NPDC057654 TaxID=3346196 RepID=UPI0036919100